MRYTTSMSDHVEPSSSGQEPLGTSARVVATPHKFVRTFASDMEALKAGGAPTLNPFASATDSSEPEVETPEALSDAQNSGAPTVVVPTPPPPVEPFQSVDHSAPRDRLVGASVLPPVAPLPESPASPVPEPTAPEPDGPAPLHTYSGDFSERVQDTHASQATILAAEQDKGRVPQEPHTHRAVNVLYVLAGIVLLLAGAGGVYYGYTIFMKRGAPIILAPSPSAPIFVDESAQVSGSGTPLMQAIEQSATRPLAPNTVRLLYDASTTTAQSIFSSLQLPAPGILLRNIVASGSMAGIVRAGSSEAPFFILSVASYGDTFSGMLLWEPTMVRDLSPLYPPQSAPAVVTATSSPRAQTATSSATVASTSPKAVSTPGFADVVIQNHDAREYTDAAGHIVVVYGYWDQRTLIIAHDEAAFIEILNRLSTSRKQ